MSLKVRLLFTNLARVMLGLLVFAQFTYVAQACLLPTANPSVALSSKSIFPHVGEAGATANLCLNHCLQAAQALDALPPPLAKDIGFTPPLPIAAARQLVSITLCEPELLSRNTSPPLSIRNCVLRD
ncbi:MAG TPA: hypothetical protein VLA73_00160 [Burkholderiales bacterium]|nr:hypothetical protein [Burkholderiales bacterium]